MRAHLTVVSLALALALTLASACAGTKATVKKPARPCPADLEQRLQTMWAEGEETFEVARVRACVEGRFGAPGWGVIATFGQPDDSQGEIGWSHKLLVVGDDGAVRATADIGGSGWMDGPWGGQLQLHDFDGDGVDELLFTDGEPLEVDDYNPMTGVGVVVVYRIAGDTAEEKLRLRVDVSTDDGMGGGGGEEEPQEPVFTCKGTWRVVDAPGGRKQLEVVTTAELKDPRPPEPEEPGEEEEPGEAEEPDDEEQPLWQRYRCAEPGTHRWQLVDGRFTEAR